MVHQNKIRIFSTGLQTLEVTLVQWNTQKVKRMHADMLSHLPPNSNVANSDSDLGGADITDTTFEISIINKSKLNIKMFAQFKQQMNDRQCTKINLKYLTHNM